MPTGLSLGVSIKSGEWVTLELDERGLFWFAVDKLPKGHYAPETAVAGRLTIGPDGVVELALDGR